MTGYTRQWECQTCGSRNETIDWPRELICDSCRAKRTVLNNPIHVLDHGFVLYKGHLGTDEDVVEAARQSTGKGFVSWEPYEGAPNGDMGIVDKLWRGNPVHGSVQEHNFLRVQVQLPIFVVREWHRHRTQSYNEMSGRYIELPDLYFVPELDRIQGQGKINKQGSEGELGLDLKVEAKHEIHAANTRARIAYKNNLDRGVSREIARVVVPVSQYTRMWASASMRNWFNFLDLRTRPDAQPEIRAYADVVEKIMMEIWPRSHAMYREYVRDAVKFSASEMKILRSCFADRGGAVLGEDAQRLLGKTKAGEFLAKLRDQ
jgi:thymidylate synthase (FAD)